MTAAYPERVRLDGRGMVVLGAGQGIGEQVAHALSEAGARVLCVDRDDALARSVAEAVGGEPWTADITNRAGMTSVFDHAEALFGDQFSGLVDVVGVALVKPFAEIDDATYEQQLDLVLRHGFLAMQIGGARLAARGGGAMTFIGSISGTRSFAGQAVYGAAKAALHHLVRCAAHEFGPSGVRVNAVSPSYVRTPRLNARLPADTWERIGQAIPLRRVGEPSDVAATTLFLQSDLAAYVTGNVLDLDGGVNAVAALPPPF